MKEFYRKYVDWIVVVLFMLVCGKSCQSCNADRRLTWSEYQFECEIELVENQLDSIKNDNERLSDSINILYNKLKWVEIENERLNDLNLHLKQSNKSLIKTTINLSNKE